MKNFLKFFAVAAMLLAAGCEEDSVQKEDKIELNKETIAFAAAGGSCEVEVASSGAWTLSGGAAWCRPSLSGGRDGTTVTFTADPNSDPDGRKTLFTFRCGDRTTALHAVQQSVALSLSVPEVQVEADGGLAEVAVTCAGEWSLSGGDAWCVPSARSGKSGDEVAFTVEANAGDVERAADFTFRCGGLTAGLTVKQGFASLSLSSRELTIESAGGETALTVTSSGVWKLSGGAAWCTPSTAAGENGAEVRFKASENAGTEPRTAEYLFHCGPKSVGVTVTQPVSNAPSVIRYTSKDGVKIEPYFGDVAQVISNTYEIGEGGAIILDRRITTIPSRMLDKNTNLLSIVIPEGVTRIESTAFRNCTNLKTVTLPESLVRIEGASPSYNHGGAFMGCTSLTEITLPEAVEYIGTNVFAGSGLKIVRINAGSRLTTVGLGAFSGTFIAGIDLPEGLETLEGGAFSGCENLKSIVLPRGVEINDGWVYGAVTRSPSGVFQGCTNLSSVTLPDDLVVLGDNAFFGCPALKSIDLPESLQEIGSNAFFECTGLESISIPAAVTQIRDGERPYYDCGAFMSCTNLKTVKIPADSRLTRIGKWAFSHCTALETITLPASLREICGNAFEFCTSLKAMAIPQQVEKIEPSVFLGCSSLCEFSGKYATPDKRCLVQYGTLLAFAPGGLTQYEIPKTTDGIWRIENYTFMGCDKLTALRIPDGVIEIGYSAFQDCTNLVSLHIPEGVTTINSNTCKNCSRLVSIALPRSVTKIDYYAFGKCTSLASVSFPGVCEIGSEAFTYCTTLTTVDLPASLTSMMNAFIGCKGLYRVLCRPTTPPAYGGSSFSGTRGDLKIYVPSGSVDAYRGAASWSDYADRIVGHDF